MDENGEKLLKLCDAVINKADEILQNRNCGFEDKPCTKKCIHYNTCTRNPYRYDQKGVSHGNKEA